ncbi:terminase small subunit [Acinetobacter variabilis]|uniref:terminase small subunit n=1 Tax=Acinetobacter variabilis TaxID=70346 RepID=UPI0030F6D0BC
MALSEKMKKFAQAVVDGLSNKEAAISAGYAEKTASQAGSKLRKDPEISVYIEKLKADKEGRSLTSEKPKVKPIGASSYEDEDPIEDQYSTDDPLDFLINVMKNGGNEMMLRVNAARAALPYVHGKVAEKGKKESRADEAKDIAQSGGKFATRSARKANYS